MLANPFFGLLQQQAQVPEHQVQQMQIPNMTPQNSAQLQQIAALLGQMNNAQSGAIQAQPSPANLFHVILIDLR
jgi:hypothetical protein